MNTQDTSSNLSEKEIDQIVVAQANDDAAWEEPVRVHRARPKSLVIPADLAVIAWRHPRWHRYTSAILAEDQQRVAYSNATLRNRVSDASQPE